MTFFIMRLLFQFGIETLILLRSLLLWEGIVKEVAPGDEGRRRWFDMGVQDEY